MGLKANGLQSQSKSSQLPSGANLEDCHEIIREMVAYWSSIHPEKGLPGRQHFDPIDIPRLLPNLRLFDVVGSPPRFRTRVMGTKVAEFFGQDQTGCWADEVYPDFTQSRDYADLVEVITTRRPSWRRGSPIIVPEKKYVIVERVYLPFARDGVHVDMIVTCTDYSYIDSKQD